jgi:hypothetical protein
MKCIVKDCPNHYFDGKFIGDLCAPCHEFITTGKGIHSQAYRNTVGKLIQSIKPSDEHRANPNDYLGGEEGIMLLDNILEKLQET